MRLAGYQIHQVTFEISGGLVIVEKAADVMKVTLELRADELVARGRDGADAMETISRDLEVKAMALRDLVAKLREAK